MQYKGVVFDLDGTLLDTLDDLADSVNCVLADQDMPTHPVDAYRHFVGNGAAMLMQRALPADRQNSDTLEVCLSSFREVYTQHWRNKTKPYDGILEMLETLGKRRFKLGVLSNKPDFFTKLCVTEFLPDVPFDIVLGHREGVAPKPDPAGAQEVSECLDILPQAFLYLGDSGIDMQTARDAAMFAVGALWGFRTADELKVHGAQALIEHPMDLLDLLQG